MIVVHQVATPLISFGENGSSPVTDTAPRSAPGYGQTDVAKPAKKRPMSGDQIWRKPDMGQATIWN